MGFYALNGNSVVDFPENSKKEDFAAFLDRVRDANPDRRIIMILDNCPMHHAKMAAEHAVKIDIDLVFLPPYSPHPNPIEFIWKTLKRTVSATSFRDRAHMTDVLREGFQRESAKQSYASNWPFKTLRN